MRWRPVPIEFSEDGRELYWLDSRGRNTAAVMAQDVESGAMRVLAEDQRADFTGLVLDPLTRSSDRGGSHFRAPSLASARPRLRRKISTTSHASRPAIWGSPACRRTGATGSSPIGMTTRRWSISTTTATPSTRGGCSRRSRHWRALPLVAMKPVIVRARDGLDLVCYLSRPSDAQAAPVPMVLLVHGGPWARDDLGIASQSPMARQPRLCGAERQLPRLDRLRQSLRQRRQHGVGGQDARRPDRRGRLGGCRGHRRSRSRRHHGRQLWRLRGAGRRHLHAGEIRLRRGPRRHLQPDDVPQHDPGILGAVEIAVEGADGRLHHGGRAAVPARSARR